MTRASPHHRCDSSTIVAWTRQARLYANQATLDYTGRTSEDVLAPDFANEFSIRTPGTIGRRAKGALERGLPFEAEQRALRRDGQYRWFLIRYNPFRNEQGQVTRWYATGTDIHERFRLEERTRNENLALREQIDRDSMFEDIVGSSDVLRKVLRQVTKVAPPIPPFCFWAKPALEKN